MAGLTSAVWTLGMFQMVTGESCQCIQRTKQTEPCHVGVRHAACTVPKCGFVIRYQNTSNLEQHYIRGGLDHKELAGRLVATQQLDRGVQLEAAADGSMRTQHVGMGEFEGSMCHVEYSVWQHETDARHAVPYLQSSHATCLSDDHQA